MNDGVRGLERQMVGERRWRRERGRVVRRTEEERVGGLEGLITD